MDPQSVEGKMKENLNKEIIKTHGNNNLNNLSIRSYLDQTVVPVLLQGIAELAKENRKVLLNI